MALRLSSIPWSKLVSLLFYWFLVIFMCNKGLIPRNFLTTNYTASIFCHISEVCEAEEREAAKMAEAEENIDGLLLPMFPELDDSGIDSDSTELLASSARRFGDRNANLEDASSSDEDPLGRPWWQGVNNNVNFNPKGKGDDIFKAMEDGRINPLEIQWPMGHRQPDLRQFTFEDFRPERASPPLYEVELTASEEDDDASVLELVIPMQSSRYKRVPTASPKKPKPKPKSKINRTFYYSFICCMRK